MKPQPLPPMLVRTPITESPQERKARESRGEALPHISYVAHSEGYRPASEREPQS